MPMTNAVRSAEEAAELEARVREALCRHDALAVAVSGGVDSMTLAYVAHRVLPQRVLVVHATSPAVPAPATARVREYARREGWRLVVTEAGEFADPAYRANPVDRCYYCKSNLYDRIRAITPWVIASGANRDDLGDYRPGLTAAAERHVVHPYVEAGVAKTGVRALARRHGLTDIAELPAQPCLASRVETGIAIDARDLAFIHDDETAVADHVPAGAAVRCRITHAGVVLELGAEAMACAGRAADIAAQLCARATRTFAGLRPYRQGAAFLRIAAA
jgi:uncharacterized protein